VKYRKLLKDIELLQKTVADLDREETKPPPEVILPETGLSTRGWIELMASPIPHFVAAQPAEALALSLGFSPSFMVYDGTLSYSGSWAKDGTPVRGRDLGPPRVDRNWGESENLHSPPVERAVKACCRLALNPSLYNPTGRNTLPVFFDLENPSVVIDLNLPNNGWEKNLQNIYNVNKWADEIIQGRTFFTHYGIFPYHYHPIHESFWRSTPVRNVLDLMVHINPWFYFWDEVLVDWECAFLSLEIIDRCCRKFIPEMPKILTVCPIWQLFNDGPFNQKDVPHELWRTFLKRARNKGFDFYLWGANVTTEAGRENIKIASEFL
jgi:hypothetical protein